MKKTLLILIIGLVLGCSSEPVPAVSMASNTESKVQPTTTIQDSPTATPETQPTATIQDSPTATPETQPTATIQDSPTATPETQPTATPETQPTSPPVPEKITFEVLDKHPDFECLSLELNKFINVFGVYVISHDSIPEEYPIHTAKILAEFIDNDLDGIPDDMNVINSLTENNYVVPVWTEYLRDKHFSSQRGTSCEDNIGYAASMYFNVDTFALKGMIEDGIFDVNIEEVWHVVSRGWYDAYP